MQAKAKLQPELETLMQGEIDARPRWHLAKRIAFRFVFTYFVLYIIPFPLEYLPFTTTLIQKYTDLWQTIVPWVGKHFLHLSYDITVFTNGSGDTTYNYVQVLCFLALAALSDCDLVSARPEATELRATLSMAEVICPLLARKRDDRLRGLQDNPDPDACPVLHTAH